MKYRELPPEATLTAGRKGYHPEEVQAYLQVLQICWQENTQIYQGLLSYNERLECDCQQATEFRQQWHAVLLTAQKTADNLLEDARQQASELLGQARQQADEILKTAQQGREEQLQQVEQWKKQQLQHEKQADQLRAHIRQAVEKASQWLKSTEIPATHNPTPDTWCVVRNTKDSPPSQTA